MLRWASRGKITIFRVDICEAKLNSVYRQLGPGKRIAVSKFAIEHFEKQGRPLRLAIDVAIWTFQTQSGEGGHNPVLRTFYYRLLRLLGLGIRPLFIFDGPQKPKFKRNKQQGYNGYSIADFMTKSLLDLIGFPYHVAPGEAEAECASLQKEGVVDAVLSEDVDTLVFGCTTLLRNWSTEVSRGSKEPSHVDLYTAESLAASGLDTSGMILVALMSGGDYDTEGIPGCGPKIACQAAKAGFAAELLKLNADDEVGLRSWRDWLQHELNTNEGGYFGRKNTTISIPEDFPRRDILKLYTNPAISDKESLRRLSDDMDWNRPLNILGLRRFVAEAFQWTKLAGAKKFIRTIAPKFLVYQLMQSGMEESSSDLSEKEKQESAIVQTISAERKHMITDGLQELRIAYVPGDIVGLDLEQEEPDEAAEESKNDFEPENRGSDDQIQLSPSKSRAASQFDPNASDKIWILETFAKLGVPLKWEEWVEAQRNPRKFATRKVRERTHIAKGGMMLGALDKFVKVSKPGALQLPSIKPTKELTLGLDETSSSMHTGNELVDKTRAANRGLAVPKANQTDVASEPRGAKPDKPKPQSRASAFSSKSKNTKSSHLIAAKMPTMPAPSQSANPWTLSRRPSDTFNLKLPPGTRFSALGVYSSDNENESTPARSSVITRTSPEAPIFLQSSPHTPNKHARPKSDASIDENVTIRRKRKTKPFSRAYTAPNGIYDNAIDLEDEGRAPVPQSSNPSIQHLLKLDAEGTTSNDKKTISGNARLSTPDLQPLNTEGIGDAGETSQGLQDDNSMALTQVSPSSVSSLPSPSVLLSKPPCSTTNPATTDEGLSPASPSPTHRRKTGELIMLRDSLEGNWRDAEPSDRTRRPGRVFSCVGVIDLTSTP